MLPSKDAKVPDPRSLPVKSGTLSKSFEKLFLVNDFKPYYVKLTVTDESTKATKRRFEAQRLGVLKKDEKLSREDYQKISEKQRKQDKLAETSLHLVRKFNATQLKYCKIQL